VAMTTVRTHIRSILVKHEVNPLAGRDGALSRDPQAGRVVSEAAHGRE
jgi:hypothetical protein